MDYLTIPNVELASVGRNWPGMSGALTFRFDHLADAVAASRDPHIQAPRIKLGHVDPRLVSAEELANSHNPDFDGEPALGTVQNMRLENDGAVLVGDFVNVPRWLAEALPSAYPNRSIEAAYSIREGPTGKAEGSWRVDTPGGKSYSFVLTAVALLGLERPAVSDLEDLQGFLTSGEGLVVHPFEEGSGVAARLGGVDPVKAEADIDRVIEQWCATEAVDERFFWWPRSARVDPNRLIVDDDEGSLYAVPFTTDADQNVSFGDPTQVLQTFVEAPAAARAVIEEGEPSRVYTSRSETPVANRSEGGSGVSGISASMDFTDEELVGLRSRLGLAPDASEDDVKAALTSPAPPAAEAQHEAEGEGDRAEGAEEERVPGPENETAPSDEEIVERSEEPPAASKSETVTVDRATWEATQRNASEGAAARREQKVSAREAILEDAVKAGKFPPSRREHYRKLHQADAKGAEDLIAELEPGLIPVDERGSSGEPSASAGTAVTEDEMVGLFPGIYKPRGDH